MYKAREKKTKRRRTTEIKFIYNFECKTYKPLMRKYVKRIG